LEGGPARDLIDGLGYSNPLEPSAMVADESEDDSTEMLEAKARFQKLAVAVQRQMPTKVYLLLLFYYSRA